MRRERDAVVGELAARRRGPHMTVSTEVMTRRPARATMTGPASRSVRRTCSRSGRSPPRAVAAKVIPEKPHSEPRGTMTRGQPQQGEVARSHTSNITFSLRPVPKFALYTISAE